MQTEEEEGEEEEEKKQFSINRLGMEDRLILRYGAGSHIQPRENRVSNRITETTTTTDTLNYFSGSVSLWPARALDQVDVASILSLAGRSSNDKFLKQRERDAER